MKDLKVQLCDKEITHDFSMSQLQYDPLHKNEQILEYGFSSVQTVTFSDCLFGNPIFNIILFGNVKVVFFKNILIA